VTAISPAPHGPSFTAFFDLYNSLIAISLLCYAHFPSQVFCWHPPFPLALYWLVLTFSPSQFPLSKVQRFRHVLFPFLHVAYSPSQFTIGHSIVHPELLSHFAPFLGSLALDFFELVENIPPLKFFCLGESFPWFRRTTRLLLFGPRF